MVRRTYPRQEATTQTDETEPSHDSDDPSGQAFGQVWSQIQGEGKSFSRIFQNQAYVWLYIILECAIIHQSLSLDNQTGASPASSPATGFAPHQSPPAQVSTSCHLPLLTRDLSFVTCDLSLVTCSLSFVTCYLSLVTCDLLFVTCHLPRIPPLLRLPRVRLASPPYPVIDDIWCFKTGEKKTWYVSCGQGSSLCPKRLIV